MALEKDGEGHLARNVKREEVLLRLKEKGISYIQ
jgi:hypothetical protein